MKEKEVRRNRMLFAFAGIALVVMSIGSFELVEGKSLYLVKGEYIDPGPTLPPDKMVDLITNVIIPSHEAMVKLQKDKKIIGGGIVAGARAGYMLFEADSNEEVTRMVQSIPFWGLLNWDVIPLESFEHRLQQDKMFIEQMKKGMK
jgi:muconolactone delta-isomerase